MSGTEGEPRADSADQAAEERGFDEVVSGFMNRAQLAIAEARNIRRAVVRYLAAKPSRRSAPFDVPWLLSLHKEMFGEAWE